MPQLVAICSADNYLNTFDKNANHGAVPDMQMGPQYLGETKQSLQRPIANFDLTPIPAGATLIAAKLQRWIKAYAGIPFPATIYRCTRPDTWLEYASTWYKFDGVTLWTAEGGDYDSTTPAPVGFTEDTGSGLKEITGLLGFANDAILNRSGIVSVIMRTDVETGPTKQTVWKSRANEYGDERWRLIVDYDLPQLARRGTLPGSGERRPRQPWSPANGRRPLAPSRGRNP